MRMAADKYDSSSISINTRGVLIPWDLLLSCGVFCLSVWGTQLIKRRYSQADNRGSSDDDDELYGSWYLQRRLRDRLSYNNLFYESNAYADDSDSSLEGRSVHNSDVCCDSSDGHALSGTNSLGSTINTEDDESGVVISSPLPENLDVETVDSRQSSLYYNNWDHFEQHNKVGQRLLPHNSHSIMSLSGEFSHQVNSGIQSTQRQDIGTTTYTNRRRSRTRDSASSNNNQQRRSTMPSIPSESILPLQNALSPSGLSTHARSKPTLNRYLSDPLQSEKRTSRRLSTSGERSRIARTRYNASIMPHQVILVRHGQSMGNLDEHLYSTTPDNAMPLTRLGWEQAKKAGQLLRHQLLNGKGRGSDIHFIVSPYVRTVETMHGIFSAWCDPDKISPEITDPEQRRRIWYKQLRDAGITFSEDPRVREQDFGNFQEPAKIRQAKSERHNFGSFYYRFLHGESVSDVYDRISTFLDSLWRSFDTTRSRQYVIVTHGISIRVLLARYFRYTIDQFHLLSNPRNCEMVVLRHDGRGRLNLAGRYELVCEKDKETNETIVKKYRYRTKLGVLPDAYVKKSNARMSYEG